MYAASLKLLARKNIHAKHTAAKVRMMRKPAIQELLRRGRPVCLPCSEGDRCAPADKREGCLIRSQMASPTTNKPCSAPQITNVQLAPCHSPLTRKTIKRLSRWRGKGTRLPPSGIYR